MENKVFCINHEKANMILKEIMEKNNSFLVVLNGESIQNLDQWLCAISENFHFPVYSEKEKKYISWYPSAFKYPSDKVEGWNGCDDWFTDLSWIESDIICLFIYNYSSFMKNDKCQKECINDYIINNLLPWWEKDVVNCVVEGKPKKFNVYLVD